MKNQSLLKFIKKEPKNIVTDKLVDKTNTDTVMKPITEELKKDTKDFEKVSMIKDVSDTSKSTPLKNKRKKIDEDLESEVVNSGTKTTNETPDDKKISPSKSEGTINTASEKENKTKDEDLKMEEDINSQPDADKPTKKTKSIKDGKKEGKRLEGKKRQRKQKQKDDSEIVNITSDAPPATSSLLDNRNKLVEVIKAGIDSNVKLLTSVINENESIASADPETKLKIMKTLTSVVQLSSEPLTSLVEECVQKLVKKPSIDSVNENTLNLVQTDKPLDEMPENESGKKPKKPKIDRAEKKEIAELQKEVQRMQKLKEKTAKEVEKLEIKRKTELDKQARIKEKQEEKERKIKEKEDEKERKRLEIEKLKQDKLEAKRLKEEEIRLKKEEAAQKKKEEEERKKEEEVRKKEEQLKAEKEKENQQKKLSSFFKKNTPQREAAKEESKPINKPTTNLLSLLEKERMPEKIEEIVLNLRDYCLQLKAQHLKECAEESKKYRNKPKRKDIYIEGSHKKMSCIWHKCSHIIRGRNPFAKDENLIDYDMDSEEEFEEENGEDIMSEKDDDEDDAGEGESEDDFIVPDGYLSKSEKDQDEDVEMTDNHQIVTKVGYKEIKKERKINTIIQATVTIASASTMKSLAQYKIFAAKPHIKLPLVINAKDFDNISEEEDKKERMDPNAINKKMKEFILMVHGSYEAKGKIIDDFSAQHPECSKASIERKIREIAVKEKEESQGKFRYIVNSQTISEHINNDEAEKVSSERFKEVQDEIDRIEKEKQEERQKEREEKERLKNIERIKKLEEKMIEKEKKLQEKLKVKEEKEKAKLQEKEEKLKQKEEKKKVKEEHKGAN